MSTPRPEPAAASGSRARRTEELAALERLLGLCEVQAVRSGVPFPLGAHPRGEGVNFAIFSRHATGVRLDLFAGAEDATPTPPATRPVTSGTCG